MPRRTGEAFHAPPLSGLSRDASGAPPVAFRWPRYGLRSKDMDGTFVSETRRGYVPVGSVPASLLATVSETKVPSMHRVVVGEQSLLAHFS